MNDIEELKDRIQSAVAEYCYDCKDNSCFEVIVKVNTDFGSVLPVEVLAIRNTE